MRQFNGIVTIIFSSLSFYDSKKTQFRVQRTWTGLLRIIFFYFFRSRKGPKQVNGEFINSSEQNLDEWHLLVLVQQYELYLEFPNRGYRGSHIRVIHLVSSWHTLD